MKIFIDPEYIWLYQKYIKESLTLTEIGALRGVSYETIRRWLKGYNIKIKNVGPRKGKPSLLRGIKLSDAHKLNLSIANKGKKAWNKGVSRTEEVKSKIQRSLTGRFAGKDNHFYGKKHTSESKEKIRMNHANFRGANNPAWLGGKSYEPYDSQFSAETKFAVRNRDKFKCQICQIEEYDGAHDVHHIDYNKKNTTNDNLITLCRSCHNMTNTNREEWENLLMRKVHDAA